MIEVDKITVARRDPTRDTVAHKKKERGLHKLLSGCNISYFKSNQRVRPRG
jgi:hypothetical protein